MRSATILRGPSTDEGTFGQLVSDDGVLKLCSLELPWRNNQSGKSCIPSGSYLANWHQSPSKGWVYRLDGTQPRSEVLIHSANFAGETELGWQAQLLGCIALGLTAGVLTNSHGHPQRAVLSSGVACQQFYDWAAHAPVKITINEASA